MTIRDKKVAVLDSAVESMKNADTDQFKESMMQFGDQLQSEILEQASALSAEQRGDAQILASRGVRQLTSDENKFYEAYVEAMKAENPKQALTNINVAFPETIVDEIFKGIKAEHPVLNYVDFQNTSIMTKALYANTTSEAVFGELNSTVTKELSATFAMVPMELMKLSAFMTVPKAFLELGMGWIDRYVREVLVEAIGNGIEKAILTNLTTANGPISMRANLSTGESKTFTPGAAVTFTTQTKASNKIKDLSVKTLGNLMAKLAKDDNQKARKVVNPFIVVSYGDYYTKFAPACTMLNSAGQYVSDVLPFGIKVVPSAYMADGEAIIGIDKQYFLGLGMGSKETGRPIEYSDDAQFVEDQRVYIVKAHANGFPKDNSSFILLDTSTLTAEVALPVTVKGKVETSAAA